MKEKEEEFAWGVKNVHFIWHGTNSDPEVSYRKHVVNYYLVEDTMWLRYKEECEVNGVAVDDNDEVFFKYCQDHEKEVKELIMSL